MIESEDAKRCSRCKQYRPRAAFASNKAMRDGLQAYCRECSAEYHQARQLAKGKNVRPRVKARGRQDHLMRQYGITEAERDELVASQGGVCCTCLSAVPEHVDHCHQTGRVRGVLCFSCNAALGQFKDRPDAIRRAAAYVEGIAWKPTLVAPGVYQLPS